MQFFQGYLALVLFTCLLSFEGKAGSISTECDLDKECLIELPGSECADGTQSFFTLTRRQNAKQVLIYLSGGGGCWSEGSCKAGYAQHLSRYEEPTAWNNGKGIHDSSDDNNPFRRDYNIITVPYCTGDTYTGNRKINYGTDHKPYVIRHSGYRNTLLTFEAVKTLFPDPEKVVLLGCSAGGIGAYYHLRNLNDSFPNAQKYVVSDAGTPFKPPHIPLDKYNAVMESWGANHTLPEGVKNFGELIQQNTKNFQNIRFSFLSSYSDKVMTFFAFALGAPGVFSVVKDSIIDLADNDIGREAENAKVFYVKGSTHCLTPNKLSDTKSEGTDLGSWLTEMITDSTKWENKRPDLDRDFHWEPETEIITPEEFKGSL